MAIDAARFQKLLNDFKLEQLFNELGWDNAGLKPQKLAVVGEIFALTTIAQKRGVAVFRCTPDGNGNIPPRPTLLKIEKEANKLAHEHLLVFADTAQTALTWLWVSRGPGQPTAIRTHTWHRGASGESLRQKLNQIVWAFEEEEAVTLTTVITGLRRAFDRDKVSKSFYEKFRTEHKAFADFIGGITAATDQAWYASLMLNRLMFVYFIQQKGFLDGNQNYLSDRMQRVREQAGKDKFHSFYRQFLRRLFHEGLGQAKGSRGSDLAKLIGEVPYLNGGLFAVHELEEAHPDIDIPDEAFERLFAFFNAYDWHLDDRPLAKGSEINPDVLGYIFEKYINAIQPGEQKAKGAYYTKEDITEYISKSTVVPHLLEQARERCKVAFDGEASIWNLLKADPDRYLYPAMKTGVIDAGGNVVPEAMLPDFVQTGMKDPKARMFKHRYNLAEALFYTATGERGTLPTETWREYVERRTRCLAMREKLAEGEIKSADHLVTLNLDIRQFMQDVIDTCTGSDLLRAIWQAIVGRVPEKTNEKFRHGIAILDPTCGSGAFLFAALNVLEPLYEACLDRMEGFIEDARKLYKPVDMEFAKVLDEVGRHPSRRYFIYKSIILHNLFGVDIMAEAVEICKLRLFLKLVSQVDGGQDLEPLPDIDFNIRVGNTLVGYATEAQFDATNTLASDQAHRIEIKASIGELADSFEFFRTQQTVSGGKITAQDKHQLRDRLNSLSLELDRYLAHGYGIDPANAGAFAVWRNGHQPFHWFAEFYGVMQKGGFDAVIGNPPYVEMTDVTYYRTHEYETKDCGDLYALVMERSLSITVSSGRIGFIVPVSFVSTSGFTTLRSTLSNRCRIQWLSSYAERPSKLFNGVEKRLTIWIAKIIGPSKNINSRLYVSKYRRWLGDERASLFDTMCYADGLDCPRLVTDAIPKLSDGLELSILNKISSKEPLQRYFCKPSQNSLFYTRKLRYFILFSDIVPGVWDTLGNRLDPSELKSLFFSSPRLRDLALTILNSSIFFWFFCVHSDVRNVNRREIEVFPCSLDQIDERRSINLQEYAAELMSDFQSNSIEIVNKHKTYGQIRIQSFQPRNSKRLIDRIDQELASHYQLSSEETDFIINYDIKYRMGGASIEE